MSADVTGDRARIWQSAIVTIVARHSNTSPAGIPVLIVDNEAASADLIAKTLQTHGYETRIAASAEVAIALLQPFGPRAIVLDLVLPTRSGVVLAQQLKQDPATRDVPIIATSVFSVADADHVARGAGCDEYVQKPIDPVSFARLVRDRIARAK